MNDKPRMLFFPAVASACGPSGGDCACGPDASAAPDRNEVLHQRVAELREHYGDRADIRVVDYTSPQSLDQAIEALNAALQESGTQLTVSHANLPAFLESVAPVVLVGRKVAFSRGVPPLERLRAALEEQLSGTPA